jgi:membrane protein
MDQGAAAMIVKGYRVGPLLRATGKEILRDGVPGLAAQAAYYFFFSLFPLFLFAAPILSFVGDKQEMIGRLMARLGATLPGSALELVEGVVTDVVLSESAPGLMSLGAVLAAWAGSNIFVALIDALNTAYDVEERRPWWKKRLLALASVLGAGIVMLVATAIMLAGEQIADWVGGQLGLGERGVLVWASIQYPLAVALLVGMAWLVYYFLPNIRQDRRQIFVGAIAATLLWVILTLAFRAYVVNFGSYSKTYGTVGGVIALLTWMYLTMLVLLIGGELNSEIHHGTGALEPRAGAVYAGQVLSGSTSRAPSNARVERATPALVAKRTEGT